MVDEYAQVQRHLEAKGLKITTGTIVDTMAPSSTKNPAKAREGQPVVFRPKGAFRRRKLQQVDPRDVGDISQCRRECDRPIAASGR
jgi:hypothetical protein